MQAAMSGSAGLGNVQTSHGIVALAVLSLLLIAVAHYLGFRFIFSASVGG